MEFRSLHGLVLTGVAILSGAARAAVAQPAAGPDLPTPAVLLDALDARAARLTTGDLRFGTRILGKDRWSPVLEYPFILDGKRFATRLGSSRLAFDGKTFATVNPDNAEAVLADAPPDYPMRSAGIDPRYLGTLNPRTMTYLRRNAGRVKVGRAGGRADGRNNVVTLQVDVPQAEVETARRGHTDAYRTGARVTVWVGLTDGLPLHKEEWRGNAPPHEGVVGSEWTWSDWVKREPGVWLPTRVRERNFGVGPDATVFTAEYVFDKVDLTRRFADADFRPDIPNGYKVHDERRGLNLIYIKGGQFLRPEPPDALAAIDGPGGQPLPAVAAAYPGGPSTAAEAKPIASASVVGGEGAAPPTGRSSRSWVVAAVAAVAAAAGAASGGLWMAHRGRRGARAA